MVRPDARTPPLLAWCVILDATWHDTDLRRAAATLAEETTADLTELRCVAPVEVAAALAAVERGG